MLTRDYIALKSIFPENRDDYWHKTMVLTKCVAGNGSTNIVQGKSQHTEEEHLVLDSFYNLFDSLDAF